MSQNPSDAVLKTEGRRLSIDRDDIGWEQFRRIKSGRANALLNGEIIKHPITADERLGMIIRLKTEGNEIATVGDAPIRETIYGDVTIEDIA